MFSAKKNDRKLRRILDSQPDYLHSYIAEEYTLSNNNISSNALINSAKTRFYREYLNKFPEYLQESFGNIIQNKYLNVNKNSFIKLAKTLFLQEVLKNKPNHLHEYIIRIYMNKSNKERDFIYKLLKKYPKNLHEYIITTYRDYGMIPERDLINVAESKRNGMKVTINAMTEKKSNGRYTYPNLESFVKNFSPADYNNKTGKITNRGLRTFVPIWENVRKKM